MVHCQMTSNEVFRKTAMIIIMRTFFVLAMLIMTTQTIHVGYVRWFNRETSVLDAIDGKASTNTYEAASLDDLVKSHREALDKIKIYENNKSNPVVERMNMEETEPYKSEIVLKDAIKSCEDQDRLIYELRYFCIWGVVFVLSGILVFKMIDEYVGLSFLFVGFCELIGYTGSLIKYPRVDSIRLLNEQFIYSLLSILILLSTAYCLGIIGGKNMSMADDEQEDD